MLKIGDFSKLTHVSVRMLRYYDGEGLLKPSAIDPALWDSAGAYGSFADWLEKNQPYAMDCTSRQVTIIDHRDTENPEGYLTEIQIPLMER